jgi:hypothetical protein
MDRPASLHLMGKHEGGGTTGISEVRKPVPPAIFRVLVTERRRETRHYFSAIAEIVDVQFTGGIRFRHSQSELIWMLGQNDHSVSEIHKSESELLLQG